MASKEILANDNISRLLWKLTLPATIGMLVTAMYNIVDTIFIGRGVGSEGIAGLSIVFPIQLIMMAFGLMIGVGAASIISRSIGAKDYEKANKTFGNAISFDIVFGIILTLIALNWGTDILKLFGATDNILPYATDYYNIIVLNSLFQILAMTGNNILRSEGLAKVSMITMSGSAVLNIILDAIFIFGLDMGIKGAAYATVISQILLCVSHFYMFTKGYSSFRINLKYMIPNFKTIKDMLLIGASVFGRQVSGSVIVVLINNKLGYYDGTGEYIAVYGIITRLFSVFFMPIFGIGQGLQPVLGYNYGAKRLDLALKSIKIAGLWSSYVSVIGFIVIQIFPRTLIGIFTNDVSVIDKGEIAVRLMTMFFMFLGLQITGGNIFQTLGKAGRSFFITMSRQVIFFIPLLLILSMESTFGVKGVFLAFPIADCLAFIITIILVRKELKFWKVKKA